jgi:predicted glycoside hydrolase/deacetylase ChbG (UPF0249 family)
MTRKLIVCADDFGVSAGVNRAILECHRNGIVTSASLMVSGAAAEEAAALSRLNPDLAVGLHGDLAGEHGREVDTGDEAAVRHELGAQLDRFIELMGRPPTHVDPHRQTQLGERLRDLFAELAAALGVPLRGDGSVNFIGGFYGQWEWGITELRHVSVEVLQRILRHEVGEGWNEISCHPGYLDPHYSGMYLAEREAEVRTLTDRRMWDALRALGIMLESYATYQHVRHDDEPGPGGRCSSARLSANAATDAGPSISSAPR